MTFKELKKQSDQIKKYIFFGEERYLFEDFLHHLKQKLDPSFCEFNFSSISQENINYVQAVSILESVPMMDRVKIVSFPNFMTRETSKNLWTKKEMESFLKRVENLDESTYLVLYVGNEDRRNSAYKKLESLCTTFELKKLNEKELKSYIRYSFKQRKLDVEETVVEEYLRLSAYHDKNVERNLYDVQGDLDKLSAFLLQKGKITREEMESLIQDTQSTDVFSLADAVLSKDTRRSFELYEILKKKDGTSKLTLSLLSLLTTSLSSYLYTIRLLPKGYSQAVIAKELEIHPFRLKKALDLKKHYNEEEARRKLEALLHLDHRFKSGILPQDMMGELIIVEMCIKE